jgi:glyoxylase-like metal-dependent hydrolase (beta-lactamase superfamily II)
MEIGEYRFEVVPDTEFWLDGGAMFGVVPRVLWERVTPPDEKNRVRLNLNCVFIDTGKERILIETGIGEKWNKRQTAMYGIKRHRPFAESLKAITGCGPEDITIVVNTHLHFDHAGGNTVVCGQCLVDSEMLPKGRNATPVPRGHSDADRAVMERARAAIPQFSNARCLVSQSEFNEANNPHERERASYLPENWKPLQESEQLELMPDNYEVVPALTLTTERGHSQTMQTWRLDAGGQTVYGFADLIPSRNHLPLPWIMGYDLEPALTLEYKKRILPRAVREDWLCLFYHDPDAPLCRLREQNNKLHAEPVLFNQQDLYQTE